jgi:hypothetical protein
MVELSVPAAIYPRFHVDLLRRAHKDPVLGQETDDAQPPPVRDNDGNGATAVRKRLPEGEDDVTG